MPKIRTRDAIALTAVGLTAVSVAIGVLSYSRTLANERKEINDLLNEAWDLLGGAEGTEYIIESTPSRSDAVRAQRLIEQALTLDPDHPRSLRALAAYHLATNDSQRALETYNLAFREASSAEEKSKALHCLCKPKTDSVPGGSHEIAAECYRAIEADPNNAYGYYNLGNALRRSNHPAEARTQYEKAIALDPRPIFHFNLGVTFVDEERFSDAAMAFSSAADRIEELSPSQKLLTLRNLGYSLTRDSRPSEALEPLRMAKAMGPTDATVTVVLANALLEARLLDEAISMFAEATTLSEQATLAWAGLADAYTRQDKCDLAAGALSKAVSNGFPVAEAREIVANATSCSNMTLTLPL